MLKMKTFKLTYKEILPALCGLLILSGSLAVSRARMSLNSQQDKRKSVSTGFAIRDVEKDPVKVTNVKVGPNNRRFGDQFEETDDWLKKLSFEVENRTTKAIIYLEVFLAFPETKLSGPEMNFVVYLGNRPGFPTKRENLNLPAGEKLIINMADRHEWLSSFLQTRHSATNINKVEMEVGIAVFEDTTAWRGGDFFLQDPNKPGRYIPVTAKPPGL